MKNWQEDVLRIVSDQECEKEIFGRIAEAARELGFEYCAYGLRFPLPVSRPESLILSNYPPGWRRRYDEANYLSVDPTVLHGRRTQSPLIWTDSVFSSTPQLWHEARSFGLKVGWAQSSLDGYGVGGMLTLARSSEPITAEELVDREMQMRWLAHLAHVTLVERLKRKLPTNCDSYPLTRRETEVLKWTADGKSCQDIADILSVSKHTVDFHVKNAVVKLNAGNKTAAVVRAAMMGMLN